MSNFGKIKNIWNLDVVSREEMKTTLQEWDDALSSLQTEFNEVKRLTTLNTIKSNSTMPGNGNLSFTFTPQIDNTRPIYIYFEKWDNSNNTLLGAYVIVAILNNDGKPKIYNNINDVKVYMVNSQLKVGGWNFQSNIVFKNFTIQYTPQTLTTTINETQEEGE